MSCFTACSIANDVRKMTIQNLQMVIFTCFDLTVVLCDNHPEVSVRMLPQISTSVCETH